jgi:hypothetical protein
MIASQAQINSALDESEMLWLDAQEQLEQAQVDFDARVGGQGDV